MVRIPKPTIIPGKAPSLELPIPPPGDAVMITGSKTVHAMGANLCRLGDIALSCSDPIRLPSSVVLAIPKGAPVLVGGPPAVDWMAAAMGLIKCKWVASRLHKLVSRIKNARLRNLLHKGVCFLTGHPVDVATGRVMTDATDFELPGPLPLVFERSYASSWAHRDSPLGHGWSHPLDQAVWLEPGCVVYRAEDGREIEFDTFDLPDHAIRPGGEVFEPLNRLTLRSLGRFRWEVETADGIIHELEPIAGDRDPKLARLVRKRTRNGHEITLHHDARARLEWVRDSGGRILRFEHDEAGRLVHVSLPHPTQPGWVPHTRYLYSSEGDLAQVIDLLGNATRYEYMGHLLVRETDRTGLSFYFGYDGNGPGAYCIRTWGDGGIYDHEIDYDKVGRVTYVTDSLGATTTYEMNVANAVVRVVDPLGGETRHEYDDNLWQTAEIDALGNATRYDHDAQGNIIRVTYADASSITMEYDEKNLPVRLISRTRDAWSWSYDATGQLLSRTNPLGETTQYQYRAGLLVSILDPANRKISLEYDSARSLEAIRWPSGASARFARDGWGRVVKRQTEPGNQRRYHHDAMGRLVAVEEPDGNVRRMAYDGEGFLIEYQDHHRRVRLRRAGFHWLVEREDADDRAQFFHDTEGRLVAVRNELGEVLQIERDACGRPRREVGFDGRATEYQRNLAGWVIEERKPSGAWTKVEHDTAGRS
jgi:YD repeat-containing protein